MGRRKGRVFNRKSGGGVIEEKAIQHLNDDDKEQLLEGIAHLRAGADLVIEQSEKHGMKIEYGSGEMVIPFDLEDGVRVIVVKNYGSEIH